MAPSWMPCLVSIVIGNPKLKLGLTFLPLPLVSLISLIGDLEKAMAPAPGPGMCCIVLLCDLPCPSVVLMLCVVILSVAFHGDGRPKWSFPPVGPGKTTNDSAVGPWLRAPSLQMTRHFMAIIRSFTWVMTAVLLAWTVLQLLFPNGVPKSMKANVNVMYMGRKVKFVWLVVESPPCRPSNGMWPGAFRQSLKHIHLSHKLRGRILMTFVYSPLAYSCKTRATTQRNMSRLQSVMNTAMRYVCRTRLSRMKDQGINHSDLRVKLGIAPVDVAMAQEQMRWLGHIVRMPPNEPTTYAKTFARGTIDVGDFQKLASSAGGRISADRKSLPDTWVHLCHQHGFCEEEVEWSHSLELLDSPSFSTVFVWWLSAITPSSSYFAWPWSSTLDSSWWTSPSVSWRPWASSWPAESSPSKSQGSTQASPCS